MGDNWLISSFEVGDTHVSAPQVQLLSVSVKCERWKYKKERKWLHEQSAARPRELNALESVSLRERQVRQVGQ